MELIEGLRRIYNAAQAQIFERSGTAGIVCFTLFGLIRSRLRVKFVSKLQGREDQNLTSRGFRPFSISLHRQVGTPDVNGRSSGLTSHAQPAARSGATDSRGKISGTVCAAPRCSAGAATAERDAITLHPRRAMLCAAGIANGIRAYERKGHRGTPSLRSVQDQMPECPGPLAPTPTALHHSTLHHGTASTSGSEPLDRVPGVQQGPRARLRPYSWLGGAQVRLSPRRGFDVALTWMGSSLPPASITSPLPRRSYGAPVGKLQTPARRAPGKQVSFQRQVLQMRAGGLDEPGGAT